MGTYYRALPLARGPFQTVEVPAYLSSYPSQLSTIPPLHVRAGLISAAGSLTTEDLRYIQNLFMYGKRTFSEGTHIIGITAPDRMLACAARVKEKPRARQSSLHARFGSSEVAVQKRAGLEEAARGTERRDWLRRGPLWDGVAVAVLVARRDDDKRD